MSETETSLPNPGSPSGATPTESLPAAILRSLRPRQWIKNSFVFAAPLFAFALEPATLIPVGFAFAAFCLVSSGTYLVNDVFDQEKDRLHPLKRLRPIASGSLPLGTALLLAVVLVAGGLALAAWGAGWGALACVAAYLLAQALYNLSFKHVLILDVMTLASGFVLRAAAGGLAAAVPLSPWFLFCVAVLAFYLGLEKRKGELRRIQESGVNTRRILRQYSLEYMGQIETAVLSCILLGYALWAIQGTDNHWMMLTVPFVFYGILRYQYLSQQEVVERPEDALLSDVPLLINLLLWILTCFLILALNRPSS